MRRAFSLEDLVSRSDAIAIGVVAADLGLRHVPGGFVDEPYRDYAVAAETVLKGDPAPRFEVMVALLTTDIIVLRESKSGKRTIEVANGAAHPLTVGGRYLLFLGPRGEGGRWTTAPEPWRFRVTDEVRPESAWAPADWLFAPKSLEEFTAAIRRAL